MLNGEGVTITRKTKDYDEFGDAVEAVETEHVDNVLFGSPSTSDLAESDRPDGFTAQYVLCFPKSFTGSLRGCTVIRDSDGSTYKVAGDPMPLPPDKCPTRWNREATVGVCDG